MPAGVILTSTILKYAESFGPFAFVAVGLADQSIVPLPGSMDALVIFFTASTPAHWWYYALLATGGTTLGSYVTYRIAKKEGKEYLEKKLGKKRAEKAYKIFDKWGFWSIFIGTILPPPMPIVPFIATAGVMQYPKRLFLSSYASGRIIRFGIVALITKEYGQSLFHFFSQYYKPALYSLIGLAVIGGIAALWYYRRHRHNPKKSTSSKPKERKAA